MKFHILLAVLAIVVVCILLWFNVQQPQTFKGCVNTTADNCVDDPSKTCAHYTCTTPEDAARINEKNINLTCGTDNVLKCTTKGTTTVCGCAPKN